MSRRTPLRVVVADDVADLRLLMRVSLEDDPRFDLVGEAGDGLEAVSCVEEHQPDVVLLDLGMSPMSGLDVLAEVKRRFPATKIVVFSGSEEGDVVDQALANGADGFVIKSGPIEKALTKLAEVCGLRS